MSGVSMIFLGLPEKILDNIWYQKVVIDTTLDATIIYFQVVKKKPTVLSHFRRTFLPFLWTLDLCTTQFYLAIWSWCRCSVEELVSCCYMLWAPWSSPWWQKKKRINSSIESLHNLKLKKSPSNFIYWWYDRPQSVNGNFYLSPPQDIAIICVHKRIVKGRG